MNVNPYIFRSNSIRGVVGIDFGEHTFRDIGRAFAHYVSGQPAAVGADQRVSSPALARAMVAGLRQGGCDVCDLGCATKGLAIYGAGRLGRPLAYISASHLPPEWNGIKFIRADGCTADRAGSDRIRDLFFSPPAAATATARGGVQRRNFVADYLAHLLTRIPRAAAPLRLLLDCGNGTAGLTAPELLRRLGFEVTVLFGEPDGRMPNRTSELTDASLRHASARMPGHDLGLAFDGDADRVAFLDARGAQIDPERFAFVMLRQLTLSQPGPIVVNAACGATIAGLARRFGRALHRVPTGVPYLVGEAVRRGAVFGMEASSHLIVPSVVPYDDAVAVAAFAAWALSQAVAEGTDLDALLAEVPARSRTRVTIEVPDDAKERLMQRLHRRFERDGCEIDTLDGLRVTTPEGWVLLRASGTEPSLRLFAEADTPAALERLTARFSAMIREEQTGDRSSVIGDR